MAGRTCRLDICFLRSNRTGLLYLFIYSFFDCKQWSGPKYVLVQRLSIMALEKSENQGDMNYPFDVDEAIRWLGGLVDLIFVFFDPIGQVYCTFLFFIF